MFDPPISHHSSGLCGIGKPNIPFSLVAVWLCGVAKGGLIRQADQIGCCPDLQVSAAADTTVCHIAVQPSNYSHLGKFHISTEG